MKLRLSNVLLMPLASSLLLSGCMGPSKAEIAEAKEACVDFYKRERAKYSAVVSAIDNWTKDGVIVVEIADKERASATSYTAHICVYDKKKGTISLPGAFNQGRWMK